MKKILFCIFFLCLSAMMKAQTYEEWSGSIGNKIYNGKGTVIAILKGDITLTGTITVDNETTLRIVNRKEDNEGTITISNGIDSWRNTPMFKVIGGSKLAFNYIDYPEADDIENLADKYNRITIDGGAGFEDMDRSDTDGTGKWFLNATTNKRFTVSLIQTIGALEMFMIDICNYYGPDNFGGDSYTGIGAIGIAPHNLTDASGNSYAAGSNLTYRYTTLKDCTIKKCKARTGTAISVGNSDYLNKTLDPENTDRYITIENTTISDNVVFSDKDGWGGIIRCRGGSIHSMKLINTTFEGNFSHGDGGGLWWNAAAHTNTKCTIDGCLFKNNRAMRNAGALRIETNLEFIGNKTTVTGNSCLGLTRNQTAPDQYYHDEENNKGNGGGIHIYGYAADNYNVGGTFTYRFNNCLEVTQNSAYGYGGGIAYDFTLATFLAENTSIISYFEGMTISDNISQKGGGGIYFNNTTNPTLNYTFKIYLNSGNITGNTAPDGGGIFVKDIDLVESTTGGDIKISSNDASAGNGGGIYLENSKIVLNSADITNNKARNGGGIFAIGSSTEKTVVEYNSGLISGNTAYRTSSILTAYGLKPAEISGIGGGIYMGEYSEVKITDPAQFGIYGNTAENGADDLFGYNSDTTISLPKVSDMDLSGYDEADIHELFWAEDYITDDPYYDKGTYKMGIEWANSNQRYRDVRDNLAKGKIYTLDFGSNNSIEYTNKYLCLTLGWSTGIVSIVKNGMKDGENAIFKIYRIEDNDSETEYMTVVLGDKEKKADGSRSREVILSNDGKWKIVETGWSWAYNGAYTEIIREIDEHSTSVDRLFEFTNTEKTDNPIHAEDIVINTL